MYTGAPKNLLLKVKMKWACSLILTAEYTFFL